ncbi:hypothetical protein Pan258_37180 [Symmachiella dynata]|uniref:AAA family ATPase n=1 Tax=Symmachiella dynata TaxID=2527995 RepID=UPI00118821D4|nr:AAA family ATPase [Symmachiella dynata]QDT49663.1 hypothetical protein Pan258_37180 [Symmachiella dynata]
MKASAVLLRWYKSFNVNYLGYDDRQPKIVERPWNKFGSASPAVYRFIEIPIRPDITTIVGANESGKSHLLSALRKVVHGEGIPEADDDVSLFNVTDLCHYATVRNKNAESWPNIGVIFSDVTAQDIANLNKACKGSVEGEDINEITLVLTHDEQREAILYFGRNEDNATNLTKESLSAVRALLPQVEFIKSNIPLVSELPIDNLLAGNAATKKEFVNFDLAQKSAKLISSLVFDKNKPLSEELLEGITELQKILSEPNNSNQSKNGQNLETQLFGDVLGIKPATIELLANIKPKDRGFAEGLIATWNQELDRKLNLKRFWQQDDQFSLSLNFKGGWFYFEIRDKTGSVYTFRERSSGLRFFLSYYIQAKSIESRYHDKDCIILMDEPDSFLSISGQKNLLAVFESLVSATQGNRHLQLIYTTHSPFLINPNYPHRIRLVRKGDAEEGSQHIPESRLRRYEPVRSALGIDCAQTLFMGEANVVLEGPSDQFLIIELIRLFAQLRKSPPLLDLSSIVVMSAESAPGVEKILAASRWGDERIPATVVLFDSDEEGQRQRERITGNAKIQKLIDDNFVVSISDAIDALDGQTIVTTEDLIPAKIFGDAVLKYINRWYPDRYSEKETDIQKRISESDFGAAGNAASTQSIFKEFVFKSDREYDKMGVLHIVVELLEAITTIEQVTPDIDEIERRLYSLLTCLRRKVEESRYESQKASARQAIVRTTEDFFKRFKSAAEAFEIQLHLERIGREIDGIGDDFSELSCALTAMTKEIQELRSTGEPVIENDEWYRWSSLLYAIRKNPLSPEITVEGDRAEPVNLWQPKAEKVPGEEIASAEKETDGKNSQE